jgi:hypothetical protein
MMRLGGRCPPLFKQRYTIAGRTSTLRRSRAPLASQTRLGSVMYVLHMLASVDLALTRQPSGPREPRVRLHHFLATRPIVDKFSRHGAMWGALSASSATERGVLLNPKSSEQDAVSACLSRILAIQGERQPHLQYFHTARTQARDFGDPNLSSL